MYFIFQCSLKMAHEEVLSALLAITEKKILLQEKKKKRKIFQVLEWEPLSVLQN